jgi:hypothetical protein
MQRKDSTLSSKSAGQYGKTADRRLALIATFASVASSTQMTGNESRALHGVASSRSFLGFCLPITVEELQIRLRVSAAFSHVGDATGCGRWTAGMLKLETTSTNGEAAMPLKLVITTVLVLGAYGGWSTTARAETQQDREACTGDVHEHCGEFIPNRDAIIQCLKQKIKKLSPACRVVMSRPYKSDQSVKN